MLTSELLVDDLMSEMLSSCRLGKIVYEDDSGRLGGAGVQEDAGAPRFLKGPPTAKIGQCSTYVIITREIKSSRDSNISPLHQSAALKPERHNIRGLTLTCYIPLDTSH